MVLLYDKRKRNYHFPSCKEIPTSMLCRNGASLWAKVAATGHFCDIVAANISTKLKGIIPKEKILTHVVCQDCKSY